MQHIDDCTHDRVNEQLNAVRFLPALAATDGLLLIGFSMPTPTCRLHYVKMVNINSRHDLSWGTKGSDSIQAVDLGAVHGVGRHVEVELVSAQHDIDIAYQDALDNIRLKRARVDEEELPARKDGTEQQQKDVYVS